MYNYSVKVFKLKYKYKRHQEYKNRKSLKRRRRRGRAEVSLRKKYHKKRRKERGRIKAKDQSVHITAPMELSMISYAEETISFINKIDRCFNDKKQVFIILKHVKFIDHSAITVLLSVLYMFKKRRIPLNGTFADDKEVNRKLIESTFFEKLFDSSKIEEDLTLRKENRIFAKSDRTVKPAIGKEIAKEVATTIWGKPYRIKGVQRVMIELMQNTHNHASASAEGFEHWWLSVNHDKKNKKVDFYFVDYGIGIMKSIKLKPKKDFWKKFIDRMDGKPSHTVMESLVMGDHKDPRIRQRDYFRGKGLPGTKGAYDRNQISLLNIIANKTYSRVSDGKYEMVKNEFNGTFIHWSVEEYNEKQSWKQKK